MSAVESGRNGGAVDTQLLRDYVSSRSSEVLKVIVDRHARLLLGVSRLYLRETPGMAGDAVRAAFLAMAKDAASLAGQKPSSLAGWLHGATIIAASSMRRHPSSTSAVAGAAGTALPDASRESMHDAIASIPAREREPLILGCLCGLGDEELSRRLGLPQGEARALLDNGRLRLSRALEAAGMDATEASVAGWLDEEAKAMAAAAGDTHALVDWGKSTAQEPLGPVSQTARETSERVSARIARLAVGRAAGLVTACVAIGVLVVAGAVLMNRPAVEKPAEDKAVVLQVASASGGVSVVLPTKDSAPLKVGDPVSEGCAMRTDHAGDLTLTHPDGSRIVLRPDSEAAFVKSGEAYVLRLDQGAAVAELKGGVVLQTEQVTVHVGDGRVTMLVGKAGKPFTRVDVARGSARCSGVADSSPVQLNSGYAAYFGEGIQPKSMETDGQELAVAGGGVFLRTVMNDYDVLGLRLDQPRFAHTVEMWRQNGLELESHFSGSKTADAALVKDERGELCWKVRGAKGRETTEEIIPVRVEGDAFWACLSFVLKPGADGKVGIGLAGEDFVPETLPASVKQKVSESAGAESKVEPGARSDWTLKWALVGVLPGGVPLYECESRLGDGPAIKRWRASAVEKMKIRFSGAELCIYAIRGGQLDKAPTRGAQE